MPNRTPRPRRYLMCRPTHFDVTYSINPWMHPDKPVDPALAIAQWERIRDVYTGLGHEIAYIDPLPGYPDMVFAANGATVVDGRVLLAKFRHVQRAGEAEAYDAWFAANGYRAVHRPALVNEGEGDFLTIGRRILAGTGFRSDPGAHDEAREHLGIEVVGLTLVDPRFYHLDTALAVLSDEEIMYFPEAFSASSRALLERLYPGAIVAGEEDALVFGLNAVSDGRHVVLPEPATALAAALAARGFEPIGVDVSELLKAGGAVKCCTLELR
ncbi:dimethylargininase [Dactylosporangium sp. NPDC048998]|uniref:dimethylargininase n=1 Tax=Dactylosporangium sp. NPDC048998 TaxID=3363976 RepID=UPI00371F9EC8